MPRFFVPAGWIKTQSSLVTLPSEAAHHAVQVLRLRIGETLTLHDGANRAYDTILESVTGKTATVRIIQERALQTEPTTHVTIAQALPKTTDKLEQVLQHGTEIGASGFLLFTGVHSVARLAQNEKVEKRLERWRGIVQSAAEQSGRGILPTVEWKPFAKEVAAEFPRFDAAMVAHESAGIPLKSHLRSLAAEQRNLLILIGPEGGFSDEEVRLFRQNGAATLWLGARILRTETAALVMLAQMLFVLEPETALNDL